jgi:hypothetical protein
MIDYFEKISTSFEISWDPEELLAGIDVMSDENETKIIRKNNNAPHWQYYPTTRVYFARNVNHAFTKQCKEVIEKLTIIQDKLKDHPVKSWMTESFLKHKLTIDNIGIIKVASGISVDVHRDINRYFALNIGLKNSNTCTTHVYEGPIIEKTLINDTSIKHSFTMQDGDVFFVAVNSPHSVESNINKENNKDRYILTYTLLG